ncbi:MAG: rRNA (guanine966-N2)-methyltransferase [Actinomycetota bacterium]|nr:rRNA (guanine966-N2)-methyltransferase [Actinomycetota bacterium]
MTRIIAGVARGRRLQVPAGEVTRPTSDRAREGMFSSLQSLADVEDARFLDLYAGSGAVGLEALSRGAASTTLVEDDPLALNAIRDNIAAVGLPEAHVVPMTAERFLAADAEPRYEIAFLDPPYDHAVAPVLAALVPWLTEDAVVAVERRTRDGELSWPDGLAAARSRRYGEATIWYAARSGSAASVTEP